MSVGESGEIKLYRRQRRPLKSGERVINFFHQDTMIEAVVVPNRKPSDEYHINNLDVLNRRDRGKGYGTAALMEILKLAKRKGAGSVIAKEVLRTAKGFWKKKGLSACPNQTRRTTTN